ncbi:MAG: hypothetical protein J6T80_07175 [Paludibacteraceae bacterium]|nr:hypothetical protein [Paludibacteraceae bacterium]
MRNCRCFTLLLLAGMLYSSALFAVAPGKGRVVWKDKTNSKTGLYTTQNFFVSHGVSLNASALYFFGDVDNEGLAFHGGFNINNLSLGGGLTFGYMMPAGNHCNMRFTLMGGTLRGNNELMFQNLPEPRDDYRSFKSIIIQPSFGVEYYPFTRAGFYLYGGVALTASIITDYQFYYYKREAYGKVRTLLQGKTFGFLPMVQLGLGYSWNINESWTINLEAMIQEGLLDTHYMNLDAFPLAPSQNSDGAELGNPIPYSKWTNRYGEEQIHWNDGWFQLGITVTYRWRNCEKCRLLDNYRNVRPMRSR